VSLELICFSAVGITDGGELFFQRPLFYAKAFTQFFYIRKIVPELCIYIAKQYHRIIGYIHFSTPSVIIDTVKKEAQCRTLLLK
jgi:hypothetical protein